MCVLFMYPFMYTFVVFVLVCVDLLEAQLRCNRGVDSVGVSACV